MIRILVFIGTFILAAALAAATCWISDGRRGRHVAPPRLPYIGRFQARRVTTYWGEPYPEWVLTDEAAAFAAIAANNPDLNHVANACADLYLIPEDTR